MSFPVAAGVPSLGSGSASKFIPQVWASKLVEKFYEATVFEEISNTDYEGVIKDHGDEVIIRTVPSITIQNYEKGQQLVYEEPESPNVSLKIDQGKYFGFKCKTIDKHQSDLNLMDEWARDGAEQMKSGANGVDVDILGSVFTDAHASNAGATAGKKSGNINLGTSGVPVTVTKANVLDLIVDYGTVLDEQSVPESSRWVVLPARICGMIKKSDLKDASLTGDGTSILRNGRLGQIDRFTIYNSNNVNVSAGKYDVVFGHKSGLTFAGQITEMEDLADPNDFGRLIRSLFVFGYEVIKPESIGHSVLTV